jgi:predicted CXXCH cytochrome family protein
MKRIFFLFLLCVIALPCGISHAGIMGTAHDLTYADSGGNFSFYATEQVCVFCHTPHGARTDVSATTYMVNGSGLTAGSSPGGFLLWNRALPGQSPGDPTPTGFSMYTSSSMKVAAPNQLNIYTLLCMGCHDGVGALNVVNNYPKDIPDPVNGPIPTFTTISNISDAFPPGSYVTSPNIGELGPSGNPDTTMHLENDHPVSIDYSQVVSQDPNAFVALTPDGTNGAHVGTDTRVRLFPNPAGGGGWFVECPSCHDVHNNPAGQEPFLVKSNAGSALCTTCHIK